MMNIIPVKQDINQYLQAYIIEQEDQIVLINLTKSSIEYLYTNIDAIAEEKKSVCIIIVNHNIHTLYHLQTILDANMFTILPTIITCKDSLYRKCMDNNITRYNFTIVSDVNSIKIGTVDPLLFTFIRVLSPVHPYGIDKMSMDELLERQEDDLMEALYENAHAMVRHMSDELDYILCCNSELIETIDSMVEDEVIIYADIVEFHNEDYSNKYSKELIRILAANKDNIKIANVPLSYNLPLQGKGASCVVIENVI